MNISKTVVLTLTILISLFIMLMAIRLLLRKLKAASTDDGKIRPAYTIWFAALFAAAVISLAKMISILFEGADNIYKNMPAHQITETAKTAALFTGFTVAWFAVWYFIARIVSVVILGSRKDIPEMESNSVGFFLINGMLVIGFMICSLPMLETVLRNFMPVINLPFYH